MMTFVHFVVGLLCLSPSRLTTTPLLYYRRMPDKPGLQDSQGVVLFRTKPGRGHTGPNYGLRGAELFLPERRVR
jgi:hypothetical protein